MQGIPIFCIRHPKRTIGVALMATLVMAPGILRLTLRTDGHALVPTDAPEIRADRDIREQFQVRDLVVIVIHSKHPEGIFNSATLALVARLTSELGRWEGIGPENVFSLATETGHRVLPGTLTFRRFLDPIPQNPPALKQLREDLRGIGLYSGTLVSQDERSTAVMVGVPPGGERMALLGRIQTLVASLGEPAGLVQVIGAPVAEALLGTHLLEDLGVPRRVLGISARGGIDERGKGLPLSLEVWRASIGRHVGMVPIALAVMALVFLIAFRSFAAVMLPLCEVGAALVFVFGLMGYLGVPVYLTIAVLPIVLTACGVADEIHVFVRYRELLREHIGTSQLDVLHMTISEMYSPVVKTSLTTAIGFLAFAISPIAPVRAFGLFTAVGILFCLIWSVTVIPAMLALIDPRRFVGRRVDPSASGRRTGAIFVSILLRLGNRGRWGWAAIGIIGIAAAVWGIGRVVIQDSWIDGFAPGSEFHRATSAFNRDFLGTHVLLVRADLGYRKTTGELDGGQVGAEGIRLPTEVVGDAQQLVGCRIRIVRKDQTEVQALGPPPPESVLTWEAFIESAILEESGIKVTPSREGGPPRLVLRLHGAEPHGAEPHGAEPLSYEITRQPLLTAEGLRRIADLEAFVEARGDCGVGGVIGVKDYVETTHLMSRGLKEGERRIPDKSERIEWLWEQYIRIRGEPRLRQLVDRHYASCLETVFLKNANFVDTARLMNDIREYERDPLAAHGIKLTFAGDVAVSQTLIRAIVETQTGSLLSSFVGSLVVTTFMTRSLVWGLLCLVPCALAVVVNFAVMGWMGIPLGVATSMFSAMVIGIGDDFAIHLVERFRRVRAAGKSAEAALRDAVGVTGPAIVYDALAVGLGFGVLLLSQVPANARLGGLLVLSLGSCLAGTLIFLPAIIGRLTRGAQEDHPAGEE